MAHIPVLLKEVVESLNPQENDFVIDGTVDGGGHMKAVLPRLGSQGIFLGVDWDERLAENCAALVKDLKPAAKAIIVNDNFRNLPEILKKNNLPKADCLLLDLGFSTEQLAADKGFSFSGEDGPLTMTYNSRQESLYELLKKTTTRELAEVIKNFGEERYAIGIADAIKMTLPKTTRELAEIIRRAVPASYRNGRLHPATRTFMALRIWVNGELENVTAVLESLPTIIEKGGRVAIISFHSLEDRLVKNAFRDLVKEEKAKLLFKKPIQASLAEKRVNPASRSAKLRVIQFN